MYVLERSASRSQTRPYGGMVDLGYVAQKIRQNAVQLQPVVKTRGGEVLLRTDERREQGYEFEDIPVVETPEGTVLRLGQIAEVDDGFIESDEDARFDGRPSVIVKAFRVGSQTPITVAKVVREEIAKFSETLAPGLKVDVVQDQSLIYKDRMELLTRNAFWGLVLVLVVLGLFLSLASPFGSPSASPSPLWAPSSSCPSSRSR